MPTLKKSLVRIIAFFHSGIIFHPLAVAAIIFFSLPFSIWYLTSIPALGIDLYYSATSVHLLQQHFSFWFNGYKDVWFTGYPLMGDFPRFHFYAMMPFANLFGVIQGVQAYALFTLLLLFISCYFLYYKISKNSGLALLLSLLVMLSPNIYGVITWGGSLPYAANLFLFPVVLFFIVNFFQSNSSKWLWASALFSGLAFLGHPLPVIGFFLPSALILLFLYPNKDRSWKILNRIANTFRFLIGFIGAAFILTGDVVQYYIFNFIPGIKSIISVTTNIGAASQSAPTDSGATAVAIAAFYKNQIGLIQTHTHSSLFSLTVIGAGLFVVAFVISLIFKQKKWSFWQVVPFAAITAYVFWHIYYNMTGHSFFPQGVYRAFWAFPIVFASLVAALWSPLFGLLYQVRDKWFKTITFSAISLTITGSFCLIAYMTFTKDITKVLANILSLSDTSSAFPEVLSMKFTQQDQEQLKQQLVPNYLNPNDKNKRIYASDATVNIWWNYLYDMPMARGYIDPPLGTDRRGGAFLLDIAIGNDTLVSGFKFSEEMAKNYALYFIDWNGIYFFEGGHLAPNANAAPSSYLLKGDVMVDKQEVTTYGAIHRYGTKSGHPEARFDLPQSLVYYRVKEDQTSPVVYGSNAPTLLVISDDPSYEQIWRILAASNLNSQYVIPIMGGRFIDDFSAEELKQFPAIILHNYDYHNQTKAYNLLDDYIKKGGKVFVDTGGETKDSSSNNLPKYFPFKQNVREELSKKWQFEIANDDPLFSGVKVEEFGPPIFNDNAWKLSYPKSDELQEGSKVLLKSDNHPLLIRRNYGKGQLIWSGINLPYHFVQYTTASEAKLLTNIFQELVDLKKTPVTPLDVKWSRPEKISIDSTAPVKGVLVKEQGYDGWTVNPTQGNQNLKIYKTGPTYPGFMYIPMPEGNDQPHLVLNYHGTFKAWAQSFVSVVVILILLEKILFDGRWINKRLYKWLNILKKKVFSWWEKEEESLT